MAKFAALLRGVNVGPTTRVPMAELRELLSEDRGFTEVATLLNSGNVVFQAHISPKSVDDEISKLVSERFGFKIDVVCRTQKQLASTLAHDPLGHLADDDSKYVVAFMSQPPDKAKIRPVLEGEYPGGEQCALKARDFYVWTPNGVSKSKALEAFGRSKAAPYATVRNVRTIKKLLELF